MSIKTEANIFYYHKNSDTWNFFCNHPKIWTKWFNHTEMHQDDADGIANSVDPDQTFRKLRNITENPICA